jgi:hypothetical protein
MNISVTVMLVLTSATVHVRVSLPVPHPVSSPGFAHNSSYIFIPSWPARMSEMHLSRVRVAAACQAHLYMSLSSSDANKLNQRPTSVRGDF